MSFFDALQERAERLNSWVCVGLDPVRERLPAHLGASPDAFASFLHSIIEATQDIVVCYKPNLAFYMAEGTEGLCVLADLRRVIPAEIPVILDAKVGDIGSVAAAYARATFQTWGFDAITVNPYVGDDAVLPFAHYADKGTFVLARTSNPNSDKFQDHHGLWEKVVQAAAQEWNNNGNVGLVVGATHPEGLSSVRHLAPNLPFLIPGVGAQGGDLAAAVAWGATQAGIPPVINSSRGIIYASKHEDFASAARAAAIQLRDEIRSHRERQQA
ncbi:MAG: orotidine-5'-phosphate decarboxylase [Anaerolineae bacterium]